MARNQLILWCQVGQGSPQEFGQDESALVDYLVECKVEIDFWFKCPRNPQAYTRKHNLSLVPDVGFMSALGTHVAIYWGDKDGDEVIQPPTKEEREYIGSKLEERSAAYV